jgi:hypothetical protein
MNFAFKGMEGSMLLYNLGLPPNLDDRIKKSIANMGVVIITLMIVKLRSSHALKCWLHSILTKQWKECSFQLHKTPKISKYALSPALTKRKSN